MKCLFLLWLASSAAAQEAVPAASSSTAPVPAPLPAPAAADPDAPAAPPESRPDPASPVVLTETPEPPAEAQPPVVLISTLALPGPASELASAAPAAAPVPARVPRPAPARPEPVDAAPEPVRYPDGFKPFRGVHLSAWAAGSTKGRRRLLENMRGSFLNAVVVPVKEIDGRVYIPGVAKARELGTTQLAIPEPEAMLRDFKEAGLYTVARVAIFKDDTLPRKRPEWSVKRPDGEPWRNAKGVTWVDPYRREVWEYNLDVALRAAEIGFDEIQFDYIRFPSDGNVATCRYSRADHTPRSAIENIREFLTYARERLKPTGKPISIAVFGMTTTARDDMGIGQDIAAMSSLVDSVSPMMYPSHYGKGEYGLSYPNREPYKVIFRGLRDARARLKDHGWKLRPYLQDFTLGPPRYGASEVQAQLLAAQKHGIASWILWNPGNHYTWKALQVRPDSPVRY